MHAFLSRVQQRRNLLDMSVAFYTHSKEVRGMLYPDVRLSVMRSLTEVYHSARFISSDEEMAINLGKNY